MENCIFCKIVKGEIPSYKVYEDENILAFLDIAPINPGHVLVIPKEHYQNIEEIGEENLCSVIAGVKKIGLKMKEGFGAAGYNVVVNNDPVAGQLIPHLHFHIIPRKEGDDLKPWPQNKLDDSDAKDIIKKLKLWTIKQ